MTIVRSGNDNRHQASAIFLVISKMISRQTIDDFFNRYGSTMNNALFGEVYDIKAITQAFADFVVGASPSGVSGGRNDDLFEKSIRQGIDFYKTIGIISMNIISKEITVLDNLHALVKVSWRCFYEKQGDSGEIPFDSVYMLHDHNGSVEIFAYVTGDEQEDLKAHKLISVNE